MAEDIKGLIDKIQEEGIKAAQDKAGQIQEQAERAAQDILERAKTEAEKVIALAQAAAGQARANTESLLKQAARDLLISLRREIEQTLNKIIALELRRALEPQELAKIISHMIKEHSGKTKEEIIISLKKADLETLEKHFLGLLKDEAKKGITLKSAEDIGAGFIISFDAGKSHYDFTDKALAEYISLYLKPQLKQILEG